MYDRARALDLIDRAIDADPYCPLCGAPTEIAEADGVIVLRCRAAAAPNGVLGRVSAAVLPHLRSRVVDLSDGVAA
ncbi:MAG: hypothetical protein WEG56_10185 [Chloroflexota bacterium]